MTGFLIPPWYKDEVPGTAEMNIASIIFGFSLGSAIFTASKAASQSFAAYKRGRLFSAYIVMCWLEWIGCNCMGIVTYIWLKGIIQPRLVFPSSTQPKGTGTRFPDCMLTRVCAIQLLGLFLHQ